jgi:hypothetical protein
MAFNFTRSSSQYLSVPDDSSLDITGPLTLAVWVRKQSNAASNCGILSKWITSSNNRSYALTIDSGGSPFFVISSDGGFTAANQITGSDLGSNSRHVSATFTPSTRQELFVDGSSVAVKTSGVVSSLFSGAAALLIGRQGDITTNPTWDGDIAEPAIWNAALTAAEIASLAKGMTPDKIRPQNLVFYAPLVRNLQDVRGGLTITNNNGATVANHPRVYA